MTQTPGRFSNVEGARASSAASELPGSRGIRRIYGSRLLLTPADPPREEEWVDFRLGMIKMRGRGVRNGGGAVFSM